MKNKIFAICLLLLSCKLNLKEPQANISTNILFYLNDKENNLTVCKATLKAGELKLSIEPEADSLSLYHIRIKYSNNIKTIEMFQPFSVLDCMFVNASFHILDPDIILAPQKYSVGDTVQGKLNLLVAGRECYFKEIGETSLRNNHDTFRVTGNFIAIIK